MTISSRTPCPVCNAVVQIEPSQPPGDAPCPNCGTLLWFFTTSSGLRFYELSTVEPLRDRLLQIISERLGWFGERVDPAMSFIEDVGAESLDMVELTMELEEEFGVTIPDEEAENLKTVGDAIDWIAKHKL